MTSIKEGSADFPANNLTWKILHGAAEGGYAVGAFNWFGTLPVHLF